MSSDPELMRKVFDLQMDVEKLEIRNQALEEAVDIMADILEWLLVRLAKPGDKRDISNDLLPKLDKVRNRDTRNSS